MSDLVLPVFDGDASDGLVLDFLTRIIRLHRPTTIVEAGTYKGHFALVMAAILRDMGVDGHIYTADPRDYGIAAFLEANGLRQYVTFHEGDFDELFTVFPDLQGTIDFAYIDSGPEVVTHDDGTHGRIMVRNADGSLDLEWASMRWRHYLKARINLAENGIIVVDDTNGDWQRVEDIREQASLVFTGARGLAICQRGRGA